MAVEQAVDQVQIARPAAPGTDRELTPQVRLGARREGRNLLVPDMHPVDLTLAANSIGNPVETVADNPVNPLDPGYGKDFSELIGDCLCHCRSSGWAASLLLPRLRTDPEAIVAH